MPLVIPFPKIREQPYPVDYDIFGLEQCDCMAEMLAEFGLGACEQGAETPLDSATGPATG